MSVIDSLVIALGVNPQGVKSGMKDAEQAVSAGMSRMSNILKSFAAPMAGMFAAGKLFSEYTSRADAVKKLSDALDVNMEDMQAWGEAAARAGGSAQAFQGSVRMLQRRIGMATAGAGQGAAMFKKFGIELKDSEGNTKDAFQIFTELAAKADTMSNKEFMSLASSLRIDQGTIQLLQQGSEGVAQLVEQQRKMGVYTQEDGKIAAEYNDALADLWQRVKYGTRVVFQTVVPALTAVIKAIGGVLDMFKEHENVAKIFFATFGAAVTAYALPALAKLAFNPFTLMIAGVLALSVALEDLWTWMNGGEAAFGEFWENFGSPDELRESVLQLWETFKGLIPTMQTIVKWGGILFGSLVAINGVTRIYRGVSTAIGGVSTALKTAQSLATAAGPVFKILSSGFSVLGQAAIKAGAFIMSTVVPAVWSFTTALLANPITWVVIGIGILIGALYLLYKHWDTVKAAVLDFWDACVSAFSGAAEWFSGIFDSVVSAISAAFGVLGQLAQAAWDAITSVFSGAVDWFKNIFGEIADGIKGMFGGIVDTVTAPLETGWKKIKGFFGSGGDEEKSLNNNAAMQAAFGSASLTGEASQAIAPSSVNNSSQSVNSETTVSIGKVDVVTQATDAEGISRDIGKELDRNMPQYFVNQGNLGVVQ